MAGRLVRTKIDVLVAEVLVSTLDHLVDDLLDEFLGEALRDKAGSEKTEQRSGTGRGAAQPRRSGKKRERTLSGSFLQSMLQR